MEKRLRKWVGFTRAWIFPTPVSFHHYCDSLHPFPSWECYWQPTRAPPFSLECTSRLHAGHSGFGADRRRKMLSEIECGICYRSFNAARRCPRELHCKHSFCESCLRSLSRGLAGRTVIDCPLCRHPTVLPGEGCVRAQLRVDECALERLVAAGVLDQDQEEEEEEGEMKEVKEDPEEESVVSGAVERGMLRRCWKKVWRVISGKTTEQRVDGKQ